MAIGIKKTKRYLDPETCFRLWMELGSVKNVLDKLTRDGVRNPKTQKPPTPMGVWNSAWMYVLYNLTEGRRAANESWKQNGELLTDTIWYTLVANKARYLLTKRKYEQFMKEHSYLKAYE